MSSHDFNFEGGKELSQMSATWFVSYSYYDKIDGSHINWSHVKTIKRRETLYHQTSTHHKFWLKKVLHMNPKKLNTNSIGLDAKTTKKMAKILLKKCYNNHNINWLLFLLFCILFIILYFYVC